jgi:uncharacterized protein HemX
VFTAPYGEPASTVLPTLTSAMIPTSSSAPIATHQADNSISKSATVGIGVAVAGVVLVLIVAAGYYLWTKHRGPRKQKEIDSLPLGKYPAPKNLEPQEIEVIDGPRVDIWST